MMPHQQIQLASLCYIKKNNKTLMIHRNKKKNDVHKGKWNGLGGKFNFGETPEECVIREVEEESGYTLKNPTLRGILTFPKFTPDMDWVVFVFTAEKFSGELKESSEGQLRWIDDDKLLDLPLWEGDPLFLEWLNKPTFFSAKFVYKNKSLKSHRVVFYDTVLESRL